MIEIPLGKVALGPGVDFLFPSSNCCNCGTRKNVSVIEQDTRRTTYLGGGGTEITFQLPLPFCPACAPSAKRRPKSPFHRALIFLLVFGAVFLGLIVLGDVAYGKHVLPLSLFGAVLVSVGLWLLGQPRGRQTSYYQPVRIRKLQREFVSGRVIGIRFFFSNKNYAKLFSSYNQRPIEDRKIEVLS
jgi:hypothetical protein